MGWGKGCCESLVCCAVSAAMLQNSLGKACEVG